MYRSYTRATNIFWCHLAKAIYCKVHHNRRLDNKWKTPHYRRRAMFPWPVVLSRLRVERLRNCPVQSVGTDTAEPVRSLCAYIKGWYVHAVKWLRSWSRRSCILAEGAARRIANIDLVCRLPAHAAACWLLIAQKRVHELRCESAVMHTFNSHRVIQCRHIWYEQIILKPETSTWYRC